ncbi:hypothetical protein [Desulfomicrobium salsuginis]
MHLHSVVLALLTLASPMFFLDLGGGAGGPSPFANLAHAAFFAPLAWGLARTTPFAHLPAQVRSACVLGLALALGGLIETIQPHFGRTASWQDMAVDALGGLAGLLFLPPVGSGLPSVARKALKTATAAGLAWFVVFEPFLTHQDELRAHRQFPLLCDFESRLEADRWTRGEIVRSEARHGDASLRVRLDAGPYPGTALVRSLGDWRGYACLSLSVFNPDPEPLVLTVSVRDRDHARRGGKYEDRYNGEFEVRQGWNDLNIPVEAIRTAPRDRVMGLDSLESVVVFASHLPKPRVIYLDYIRLRP